jgi:release factor glutamine methyltransferase
MTTPLKTVRELILVTTDYFQQKDVESARLNAERLLGNVLGLSRLELYLHHDRPLTLDETAEYREFVKRRVSGQPLQTILGEVDFYSRSFVVEPGVFIPRPETEILIQTCVDLMTDRRSSLLMPSALEIGVGTGVIGISLAAEMPRLRVRGSDINPDAVDLARRNAHRLGVDARVEILEGHLFEPFGKQQQGEIDLLVSNPPYIRFSDIQDLSPEVRDHDPHSALDGGSDGLDFYRALAAESRRWLRPGGRLAVEIGAEQGESVPEIFRKSELDEIKLTLDYNDLPRVVTARAPGLETGE